MEKLMRNLILSTLSTLALLIHPLSLSAQNSFSLSLDINDTAGDQAVTSLNVSADQVVAIQIFGTDIQNANGLAVRFEYDADQVTYDGFDVGNVLPNAQALPEQGTNPTFVEIGIASLGGQTTANSGLVGTIRFRATAAFSGTEIRLSRAELSRGGRFETITPNISIALQGVPTPSNFSLSLDVDGTAGNQAVTSVDISTDEMVAIQIFGKDILNADGISIRFEYDANQVTYEGFDAGDMLPNAQALTEQGTNPTFIQIGIVSFGGQATVNSGLVGTIRFRATSAFSGTEIRLARAELSRSGQIESVTIDVRIALQVPISTAPTPDFDGNGIVNIADFLAFVSQFGNRRSDGKYDAKYDLDSDGVIGISDFLSFVNDFGKKVPSSGGGGTSSPDLIVESPSVSDSTLTMGQSFTLQATVRNQGSGQAAATTLRYYQSLNATISSSDTRVGSDAIGSLNTSSSSVESISLNAPSSAGTYYYGACVSSVSGESNTNNNCSRAVRVTVSSGGGSTTNVDIPDASLRAVIADSLGKASGAPITRAEMASLTRLEALNKDISDLTGLEFATNLTSLGLSNNLISDVSPLSGLTNLTRLDLRINAISDVSPLSGLTNLTELDLTWNLISDVSPLSGLTNLTRLWLWRNLISDVSPLSGLTNLTHLWLWDNSISDVSPLSGLTNLIQLILDNNLISDVSPLSGLTNLRYLELDANLISDVSPLSGLTNLTRLNLRINLISDVSLLSGLTNLTRLWLGDNLISDVSPLSGLTNLTSLILYHNTISEVSALAGLTSLEYLDLENNAISDISPLANLINLTNLYLSQNLISDISPLANLTNLIGMDIYSNIISDISPLANLTNLTLMSLEGNTISNLSPLSDLNNLEVLYLGSNTISDISPLSDLTNLTNLRLPFNSISDIAPLVANMGLGSEDRVDLRNNPLSTTSINTHIPVLQNRGVNVIFSASKPGVLEKEPRPIRAAMKPFGVAERGEDEYIYHKRMETREDEISPAAKVRRERR